MAFQSRTNQKPLGIFQIHVLEGGRRRVDLHQAQIGGTHHLAARQKGRSLDDITQLADVTWPGVVLKCTYGVRSELAQTSAIAPSRCRQHGECQWRDIRPPLPQRRNTDLDRIDPEQQILTKPPFRYQCVQIGIGRRDQSYIDLARARGADRLELTAVEYPQ